MLRTHALLRWLQRKRYQYEVTFSLYMLTPTEKFVFNSLLFLFLSMILIAASLYLPEHIAKLIARARFYYAGPSSAAHPPNSQPFPLSPPSPHHNNHHHRVQT